jgi:hypothetical protein
MSILRASVLESDPEIVTSHGGGMTAVIERPSRVKVRHAWVIPGLALAFYANALAAEHGLGLVPVLLFGIAPHVTVLAGIGQPRQRGQLAPRAVPLFNAMHHPIAPLAFLALAAVGVLPAFWLVGALAWLGHIAIDLAMGDGLRTAEGWRRPGWSAR